MRRQSRLDPVQAAMDIMVVLSIFAIIVMVAVAKYSLIAGAVIKFFTL